MQSFPVSQTLLRCEIFVIIYLDFSHFLRLKEGTNPKEAVDQLRSTIKAGLIIIGRN